MDRRAGRVDRADGVLEGLVGLVAVAFAAAAPQHDRRHQQYSPEPPASRPAPLDVPSSVFGSSGPEPKYPSP